MFRKLTDKLSAAANSAANALSGADPMEQKIQALQSMGFGASEARNALQATNGSVDRAAELLLANSTPAAPAAAARGAAPPQQQSEAEMNRAIQASLEAEEARQLDQARKASAAQKKKAPPPSAAATKAGQAAVARAANGEAPFPTNNSNNKSLVCAHHPDVKVPKRLSHKPKEEQLLRCADRMKGYPRAVDTIYICLTSIQKDPDNEKYRKIDKTTAGYQRTLANTPGAHDMFKAMNFEPRVGTNWLVLSRDRVDPALLYLGISALETTRQTTEYLEAKRKLQFAKEVAAMFATADASTTEAIQRAHHMSKCPSEPSGGRGALITVQMADRDPVRRKFDGDDTLDDLLNWLGGIASPIPQKLLTRQWSLMDLNRYPLVPTDVEADGPKTLQYLGLFPSGRLEVVASTEAWQLRKSGVNDVRGSALGLGAGK